MARLLRTQPATTGLLGRSSGSTFLGPPVVVGEGIVFPPIQGYLFPVADVQQRIRQRGTEYRLRPPTVVTQPAPFVARPILVYGADEQDQTQHRSRQRATNWLLRPPVVIDLRPQTVYLSVNLAYSRRGVPKSKLRPPTDTIGLEDQGRVRTRLVPSPAQARKAHPRLSPPTVIDLTPQTRYLNVNLAYSRRGAPRSRLFPPAVVSLVVVVYYGPKTALVAVETPAHLVRRRTMAGVRAPVFVGGSVVFRPVKTRLAYQSRERGVARLFPPAVVTQVVVQVFYGPQTTLAPQPKPFSRHTLFPPAAVGEGVVFAPISGNLFPLGYQKQPRPKSVLRPPTVVTVSTDTFYGPATWLTYSRRLKARYGLAPPAIVDIAEPVLYPVQVTLAYSLRGKAKSALGRPVVVGTAVYYGPSVTLAYSLRGRPVSELRPPTVVFLAVEIYGPKTVLAYSVRKRGTVELKPPTVIDLRPQVYYLSVSLTRIRPVPTTRVLRRPVDVVDEQDKGRVRVTLAPSARQARQAHSRLRPPTVIDLTPQTVYLTVWLAYSRRGAPKPRLEPPTVVDVRVYTGPAVTLAYSVRGRPVYDLHPPTVIDLRPQTYYLTVSLAYSRRGRPLPRLEPPTIVGRAVEIYGPVVSLTRIRPVRTVGRVEPPTVVFLAVEIYGPRVTLTRITPPPTVAALRPPTVIDLRPQVYYLSVSLARITPPPTLSRLISPTTTEALPRAERDLRITLAYQSRGRPKSVLRKPVVIDLRSQVYYLAVTLAYSRRGKAKSRLSFVAGQRIVFFGPQTTLTYSVRGRPESRLAPPVVVRVFVAPATAVHLAYSRRGRPVYKLRPPTRVQAFIARPTDVTIAYSLRGKTKSRLVPPTVIRVPENRRTRVTLVRIVPAPTVSALRPPQVVRVPENRRTRVMFAYQSRGVARYGLAPPAVVAPAPPARPIQVTLVRIKPPQRFWRLRPPAVVGTFVPPHGDVCGFDIAGSFDCGDTTAEIDVCGTDQPGSADIGSDRTESRITGDDSAVGDVCGSDEQAT